jgi:hypothetical protein
MDGVGIDVANTICLEGADYASRLDDRDLAREAVRTCNTWLAEQVDAHCCVGGARVAGGRQSVCGSVRSLG